LLGAGFWFKDQILHRFTLEREIALPREANPVKAMFLPGGKLVLYHPANHSPVIVDASGSSRELLKDGLVLCSALNPDGTQICVSTVGKALWIVSTDTGLIRNTIPSMGVEGREEMVWSPDSRWIACAGPGHHVTIGSPLTGRIDRELPCSGREDDEISTLAFSPAGGLLAAGGGDGLIDVWEPSPWRLLRNFKLPLGSLQERSRLKSLAFSPDGSLLAASGGYGWTQVDSAAVSHGTILVWKVADGTLYRSVEVNDIPEALSFSPDGQRLAFAEWGRVTVWDLRTSRTLWSEKVSSSGYPWVQFGDDGRLIAAIPQGNLRIWKGRYLFHRGVDPEVLSSGEPPNSRSFRPNPGSQNPFRQGSVDADSRYSARRCDARGFCSKAVSISIDAIGAGLTGRPVRRVGSAAPWRRTFQFPERLIVTELLFQSSAILSPTGRHP